MTDTRSSAEGAAVATTTASRLKTAAPAGAAALAVVAAVVAGTMLSDKGATTDPTVEAPAATAATQPQPDPGMSVAAPQFDQAQAPGATTTSIEILVKFKDDAKVKDIIDAFWKDPAAAKAKFETFKAGKAVFAGLKLDRVTYSNELVLVGSGPAAAMRELADKMKTHPDIAYADPNLIAHPGGQ